MVNRKHLAENLGYGSCSYIPADTALAKNLSMLALYIHNLHSPPAREKDFLFFR